MAKFRVLIPRYRQHVGRGEVYPLSYEYSELHKLCIFCMVENVIPLLAVKDFIPVHRYNIFCYPKPVLPVTLHTVEALSCTNLLIGPDSEAAKEVPTELPSCENTIINL